MCNDKPSKREDIVFRKIGDEAVLYNTETRLVHILNLTAERVWGLCDGKHNIAEIKDGLRQEFIVEDKDPIHEDIESILSEFKKHSLLEQKNNIKKGALNEEK